MRKILDRRPVEVHLIVEDSGINRVQIIGRLDQHKKGSRFVYEDTFFNPKMG